MHFNNFFHLKIVVDQKKNSFGGLTVAQKKWVIYTITSSYVLVSAAGEEWTAVYKVGRDADKIQWTYEFQDSAVLKTDHQWRRKATG